MAKRMDIKPLGDQVMVEQLTEQHDGKIVIPDNAKQKSQTAKVIALGTGKPNFTFGVKIGDTVLIPALSFGQEERRTIERDGKEFLLFHEHELLAIL